MRPLHKSILHGFRSQPSFAPGHRPGSSSRLRARALRHSAAFTAPAHREGTPPPMLQAEPEGLLAARLVEAALAAGPAGIIFVAHSETRAARLHRTALALAPKTMQVLLLPGWDCLPYDRVSPTRGVMGRRMAVAEALLVPPQGPRLLVASTEAASQRLPRPDPTAVLRLARGEPFETEAVRLVLLRLGYGLEEQADEPGDAALHGGVLDLCPAYAPGDPAWRIRHEEGRIEAIQRLDILTQRSMEEETEALTIGPA